MSIWDTPDLRASGDYVKFENVGDTVAGTITAVRAHRFNEGEAAVPQLLLLTDDGEEKSVTAGQVRLKAALAEQRPEAGDHISITLSEVERRAGGKTLKHFDVKVKRGAAASPANFQQVQTNPGPPPAFLQPVTNAANEAVLPPRGYTDPNAAAVAALANLTPDQLKALGLSTS